MATAPRLVPLDEYMRKSYSPDCKYVDGIMLEGNVGSRFVASNLQIEVQLRDLRLELPETSLQSPSPTF